LIRLKENLSKATQCNIKGTKRGCWQLLWMFYQVE
jgi:hypothetical protein